jgi:chromosome segregation ATPase
MRVSKWQGKAAMAALMLVGLAAAAVAQQQDSGENRLRTALRQATIQLREQEDQNATLQAKQAEAERSRLALQQKLDADEKELAGLRHQVQTSLAAGQESADADKKSLAQWQTAYNDAANIARTRDGDAKRADAELVKLREQLRQEQEKNQQLYKLGQEILDLYDRKDLGSLLAGSEPVTKLKRVEYENIMQDYQDKLRASQVAQPSP